MINRIIFFITFYIGVAAFSEAATLVLSKKQHKSLYTEYMIIASQRVVNDAEWSKVLIELKKSHPKAVVCNYKDSISELIDSLRYYFPRYLAVVEQPEFIGRDFVIKLNQLTRNLDKDIYEDCLLGIITGYNAKAACRVVKDARKPFTPKVCVSTICDLGKGKWFDAYANLMDSSPGTYRIRRKGLPQKDFKTTDSIENRMFRDWDRQCLKKTGKHYKPNKDFSVRKPNTLTVFDNLYTEFDPDILFTASHATENNLEMPFSAGNILCKDGKLYLDYPSGPQFLRESGKTRVYLPVGNCLIGNVNNTRNSMVCAWMNSAHVSTFVGYVVPTWYGRNGWGGVRTMFTNPGRYSIAESFYLNRQDLLYRLQENCPSVVKLSFPYGDKFNWNKMMTEVKKIAHTDISNDILGQWYDRDVVAFYGDPKWNVRLKEIVEENDFSVKQEIKGNKCTLIIETKENFSYERMQGGNYKKSNLQPMPFTYIFPQRLRNLRLTKGQKWKAAVDENFIALYTTNFEPSKTYIVKLKFDNK